jgi:uncharacterized membrane protein YuzA (DUF378 family)
MKQKTTALINKIAKILLIAGGLVWGLTLFGFNPVQMIADATASWVSTIIYALVGLSAVYKIFKFRN